MIVDADRRMSARGFQESELALAQLPEERLAQPQVEDKTKVCQAGLDMRSGSSP